jgi:hypothetical protein
LEGFVDAAADEGLVMFAYTAEPGSKSAEALALLGSWAATPDALSQDETASSTTPRSTSS